MIKPVFKVIASVLFVALIIEIFLQIFGDRLPSKLNTFYLPEAQNYKQGQKVVLCLGDSMTAWGMEKSYPAQLQNYLEQTAPGQYYVMNRAKLGETSLSMIDSFKSQIENTKPDFVVSMIGLNDYKLIGRTKLQLRIRILSLLEHLLRVQINSIRGSLLDTENKEQEIVNTEIFQPSNINTWTDIETQVKQYLGDRRSVKKFHAALDYLMVDGATYSKKSYELAVEVANSSLQSWPADNASADNRAIAAASIENYPKAEEYLEYAYKIGSRNPVIYVYYAKKLKKLGKHEQALRIAQELFTIGKEITGRNKEIIEKEFPEFKNQTSEGALYRTPEEMTALNYQKLYALTHEHQIHLILLPYPLRNLNKTRKILEGQNDIEFVDYQNFFENSKIEYSEYFVDRSGVDLGHLTPKSSEYVAKLAGEAILRKTQNQELKERR